MEPQPEMYVAGVAALLAVFAIETATKNDGKKAKKR